MAFRLRPSPTSTSTSTATLNPHKGFFSFAYWPANYHPRSSRLNLHRRFPISTTSPHAWSGRCSAASPGPPSPPPESDPQPPSPSLSSSGVGATLTRIQDTVQIFFAVLFWMSLFFWASAWDGRNDDRTNRGSRFRR